jgi:hypothetical protein
LDMWCMVEATMISLLSFGIFPLWLWVCVAKKSRAFGFKVEHWTAGHTDKYVYAIFKGTLESKVAPSCRYFYQSVFVSSAIPSYLLELCCGALSTEHFQKRPTPAGLNLSLCPVAFRYRC